MGAPRATDPAHAPPRWSPARWLTGNARHDVPASLVVFLIAVPLSLGIAAASGAPVFAGLVAAVIGGVVAGSLGGSPLQVSGPAAGLTVVVAELVIRFGWPVTCAITVLAGLLQLLLGACRVGRVALAISPTVVHAMLAGIGITIVLGQLHVVLGGKAAATAWENVRDLPATIGSVNLAAAALGVLVIILLTLVWPRMPEKVRRIPGPLIAILAATGIAVAFRLEVALVELPNSILTAISLPSLPEGQWFAFALGVFTVTIIASVESLLSAVAVDKLHTGPRSNLDRELVGQGAANVVSGMLGGLPVTGVIVRSSTNVKAGARTRASAVLHGLWIALFAVLLVGLVELIPMAALAGLLVVVGANLVRIADIRTARRHGELLSYAVTVAGVVLVDLLHGVLIGLVVALLAMLRRILWARVRVEQTAEHAACGRPCYSVVVEGVLSFLSVPRLSRLLGQVPQGTVVHLELVVDYLDHGAYEHLSAWCRQHEATGGSVAVDEFGGDARPGPAPRWFSPWSHWSRGQRATAMIPQQSRGRLPRTLVLTCADSPTVPTLTGVVGTGDLFTVRNVGNLVPDPREATESSVHAGVQYALDHLNVPTIVVCGHAGCGAMRAVLGGPDDGPIGAWLHWAAPSARAWRAGHPLAAAAERDGWSAVDQLAMVNVAVQLDALRAMPAVRAAVLADRVKLVGLFSDPRSATVLILDEETDRFLPFRDRGAMPGVR